MSKMIFSDALKSTPTLEPALHFPAPDSNDWAVGMPFDIFRGVAVGGQAFDEDAIETEELEADPGHEESYTLYEKSQLDDLMQKNAEIHGEGWGCKVNASSSTERVTSKTEESIVIIKTGYAFSGGKTVMLTKQQLSKDAADLLKESPTEFRKLYGTHFISAVIYGKSISAQWVVEYLSQEIKEDSAKELKASYSSLENEASLQASINTSVAASSESTTQRPEISHLGWTPSKTINSADDLDDLMLEYVKAEAGDVVLSVIVKPWEVLNAAKGANSGNNFNPADCKDLVNEINQLQYLVDSAGRFLDSGRYAGQNQFDRVSSCRKRAADQLHKLKDAVRKAVEGEIVIDYDMQNDLINNPDQSTKVGSDLEQAIKFFVLKFFLYDWDHWPKDYLGNMGGHEARKFKDKSSNGYHVHIEAPGHAFSWSKAEDLSDEDLIKNEKEGGYIRQTLGAYKYDSHLRHFFVRLYPGTGKIRAQLYNTLATTDLKITNMQGTRSLYPSDNTQNTSVSSSKRSVGVTVA